MGDRILIVLVRIEGAKETSTRAWGINHFCSSQRPLLAVVVAKGRAPSVLKCALSGCDRVVTKRLSAAVFFSLASSCY